MNSNLIPLSFVLGFYVSIVMTRWWNQYLCIPWPDPIAVYVSTNIHGQDERGRLMRRTIMRYVCLCQTMVLTMISPKVKKRFPTFAHLVEAGLLLENEQVTLDNLNSKFPKPSKHWLPIVWAASIVMRARKEGRIQADFAVKTIIDELNKFRGQCKLLTCYDNMSVPLVYTQVVTLAVYSYFVTSAMGRQWTENKSETSTISNIDQYFPFFTTLQFFFYMGWLKVAESLINPFGEDDDDFEVNWMVDRNLQVSYMIVDEMHNDCPELIKDQYWDEVFPAELPYTAATQGLRENHPLPSTAKIEVSAKQSLLTGSPSSIRISQMANDDQAANYKFPAPENSGNEDAISGIQFFAGIGRQSSKKFAKDRNRSLGSQNNSQSNLGTSQGSISRANSVTSALRKLLSKEEQNRPPLTPTNPHSPDGSDKDKPSKLSRTTSNASLSAKLVGGGSKRIANQVIEEVDEQNTITSMATKNEEIRPTAESIFAMGPPPPSAPVDVPQTADLSTGIMLEQTSMRRPQNVALSSSAPNQWTRFSALIPSTLTTPTSEYIPIDVRSEAASVSARPRLDSDVGPLLSAAASQCLGNEEELLGTTSNESVDDEFQLLKTEREKQRKERYMQKWIARSISAQQALPGGDGYADNEILLMDLNYQSKKKTTDLTTTNEDTSND